MNSIAQGDSPINKKSLTESRDLNLNFDIYTRESIVEIHGRKFRKVEYKDQRFYLQLLGSEEASGDLNLLCNEGGELQSPTQIQGTIKMTKRSSFFIEGLKQMCAGPKGKRQVVVSPEIAFGFVFDQGNAKAIIRNKQIFYSPLTNSLGFKGEW